MTEIEKKRLKDRNEKIINVIISEINQKCPGSVDLIGIAGSFCSGDIYEYSDLDLVIIINNKKANILNKCFILENVGFDIYTQDWSRFESMAEYNSPYVTKLFELDVVYKRNEEVLEKYNLLRDKVKKNMSDEDRIMAKIGLKFEEVLKYYRVMLDSEDKGVIYREYAHIINCIEYIVYMLNKTYIKRGTKRIPEEINDMQLMPEGLLDVYNSLMNFEMPAEVKIKAFGLVSIMMRYLKKNGISYDDSYVIDEKVLDKQDITSDLLTGTYEEIYSNWKNKMIHACSINSSYLSFVTMASAQEFYDEMSELYNIPHIDFIAEFNPADLVSNVSIFDSAMMEWKKLYDKFDKTIVEFDTVDSLDFLYKR